MNNLIAKVYPKDLVSSLDTEIKRIKEHRSSRNTIMTEFGKVKALVTTSSGIRKIAIHLIFIKPNLFNLYDEFNYVGIKNKVRLVWKDNFQDIGDK